MKEPPANQIEGEPTAWLGGCQHPTPYSGRPTVGHGASVLAATRRIDQIDEMIRIVGDSVTDPTHQANAPKFPDRRRRPHGRR